MDIIKTYRLIPIEEGESYIKLLVPKGYDVFSVEEIRFITGKSVEVLEVEEEEFSQELQKRLAQEEVLIETQVEEDKEQRDILLEEEKSPAVSFVNATLIKATTLSASDIHIEPYEDVSFVRFRLDGILHDYMSIPLSLHESVISRIKVLANLDVAERRVPQDGKIRVRIGKRDLDIRVSIVPTTFGER
ncbi:MAG: GspE/PulE family protein, partial [Hydrogenobacter sp.]